jgi:hypothetical protein
MARSKGARRDTGAQLETEDAAESARGGSEGYPEKIIGIIKAGHFSVRTLSERMGHFPCIRGTMSGVLTSERIVVT